ncbi:MAG: 2OG-Fe(II) oxygenase [Bacteroidetes bacterium]|nr:2OG-Fe(II) oxygenase [Bacteroidota bacterium]
MEYIDMESLQSRLDGIRADFNDPAKPFRYVMFENFFYPAKADLIYQNYPAITDGKWDGTTYVDQKNKFAKTKFEAGSVLDTVFREMNSVDFTGWLEQVTGIPAILGDEELFGGGLHQSIAGAFLNVHVDYNIHPTTKYHRRMNVLVYMNKDWKDEYEGHLELWDLSNGQMNQIAKIAPLFNRCVIFETSEVSFHGHPKPLNTPAGINRKSIATYYYTADRPADQIAAEHNTIYVNTEGATGQLKRFNSGVKAFLERININKG